MKCLIDPSAITQQYHSKFIGVLRRKLKGVFDKVLY